MRWVRFSERLPSAEDQSSVSSEGQVIIRGVFATTEDTYATTVSIDDCHDWGVDMTSEWLEAAFESEVTK